MVVEELRQIQKLKKAYKILINKLTLSFNEEIAEINKTKKVLLAKVVLVDTK